MAKKVYVVQSFHHREWHSLPFWWNTEKYAREEEHRIIRADGNARVIQMTLREAKKLVRASQEVK